MLPKIDNYFKSSSDKKDSLKIYPEFDYVLRFDGCSKGNPGLAGAGAIIYYHGEEYWSDSFFVGNHYTNNHAEYAGLILGLQQAKAFDIKQLQVEGDSMLVINQMIGTYKCKSDNLIELHEKAKEIEEYFDKITYSHILRHKNKQADKLANDAIEEYLMGNVN